MVPLLVDQHRQSWLWWHTARGMAPEAARVLNCSICFIRGTVCAKQEEGGSGISTDTRESDVIEV